MMRFLHTADWQIGMKCSAARTQADAARQERLRTVERIVSVANQRAVDFVVIAGDLFDTRTPKAADYGMIVSSLQQLSMPTFVLPGNHDPAGTEGPYASAAWSVLNASRVTTIQEPGVYQVPGGVLLAAPCASKYSQVDPTSWFGSSATAPETIRIGLAHGSAQLGEIARTHVGDTRGKFPISPKAASLGRLDYLALGDWHSFMEIPDGSAIISYSGTPEATAFGEPDSGTVSIVTIEGPGARPEIERVTVGRLHWLVREFEVSDDVSIGVLNSEVMSIDSPSDTLLRVTARGLCTPSAALQLQGLEAVFEARFMHFEMHHEYLARPETRDAWLSLVPPGELTQLVNDLLDKIERDDDAEVASRALDRLAEFAR